MAHPYFIPSPPNSTLDDEMFQLNTSLDELQVLFSNRAGATLENRPFLLPTPSPFDDSFATSIHRPFSPFTQNPLNSYLSCINEQLKNPPNLKTTMLRCIDQVISNRTQAIRTHQPPFAPNQFTPEAPRFLSTYYDPAPTPPLNWVDDTPRTRSVHSQTDIQDVRFPLKIFNGYSTAATANRRQVKVGRTFYSVNNNYRPSSRPLMNQTLFTGVTLPKRPNPNYILRKIVSTSRALTICVPPNCETPATPFQQTFLPIIHEKPTKNTTNEQEMYRTRFLHCFESTCEQTFFNQIDLKIHMKKEHDIPFYSCPLVKLKCGRSFNKRYDVVKLLTLKRVKSFLFSSNADIG